ncbi:MAG: tyrosine-type recombinase/integrase [Clostridia bacterium]|nr:tyrosine-type recombinase/integrase [Clostridia bacterium]
MSTTQPIRKYADIRKLKEYFLERGEYRDYMLVSVCLNSALRICDVINLKWTDIFDKDKKKFKKYIELNEKKTGKSTAIFINNQIKNAVNLYIKNVVIKSEYLFPSRKGGHITRYRAFEIINKAGINAGLDYNISCHSLRKTFGYHAWKKGIQPAVIMNIYNHCSFSITKRYLGINQEDKDEVFRDLEL